MAGRLAGKVAIVTGASRGLGAWCAEGFAREGAAVIPAARTLGDDPDVPETLAQVARAIRDAGGEVTPVVCDVSDPASVQALAGRALQAYGRIDILMTNAVFYAPGSFSTVAEADWLRQFDVNVHGVFNAIRAVLPAMTDQGSGSIITVSSVAAGKPSHYGATKRVVEAMTQGFAAEQRDRGVAVNALRPVAAVRTPGWMESRPAEVLQTRAHRVSPPDSYVEAAILLAGKNADEVSGQSLTDAEVIRRFGAAAAFERFRSLNAPVWSEGF